MHGKCAGLCCNDDGGQFVSGDDRCSDPVEPDIEDLTEAQKTELKTTGRVTINGEQYKVGAGFDVDVKVLRNDGTIEQIT